MGPFYIRTAVKLHTLAGNFARASFTVYITSIYGYYLIGKVNFSVDFDSRTVEILYINFTQLTSFLSDVSGLYKQILPEAHVFSPIDGGFPALAIPRTETRGQKFSYHAVQGGFPWSCIWCLDVSRMQVC